jgi:hypothetical protein
VDSGPGGCPFEDRQPCPVREMSFLTRRRASVSDSESARSSHDPSLSARHRRLACGAVRRLERRRSGSTIAAASAALGPCRSVVRLLRGGVRAELPLPQKHDQGQDPGGVLLAPDSGLAPTRGTVAMHASAWRRLAEQKRGSRYPRGAGVWRTDPRTLCSARSGCLAHRPESPAFRAWQVSLSVTAEAPTVIRGRALRTDWVARLSLRRRNRDCTRWTRTSHSAT